MNKNRKKEGHKKKKKDDTGRTNKYYHRVYMIHSFLELQ
jgi:hypothetical protein